MSGVPGDNVPKELEGDGSKENLQDDDITTCDDLVKHKESWKTIPWSLLLVLNLVAASLDPLFFYIPTIDDEYKCLKPDRNLGITAISLRFFVDILQLFFWLPCHEEQLLKNVPSFLVRTCRCSNRQRSDSMEEAEEAENNVSVSSANPTTALWDKYSARLIQLLSILPLPQVSTIIIIAMDGSTKSPQAVTLLKFCVLSQFVIRAIRVYPSYKDATKKSPILRKGHIWVGAAFNLLLFLIAGHVLGAFWYLLSVGRNMDCWNRACERHAGCDVSTLYCIRSSGDKTYLNQSCPIGTSDNLPFDFGIYLPALQSNIVSSSDFSLKLAYCFWWGLRNLSSLAQNLTTSTYQWEICFAISISIFGLILFSLLIGNMQTYLQSVTNKDIKEMKRRRDKVKEIRNNLFTWMPFQQLTKDLKMQIILCEDDKLLENKDIDLKGVLNTIAPKLRLQIKEQLCGHLLSKLPQFEELNERPLKMLCNLAKPKIFEKSQYVFKADSEIKELILLVSGQVCSYKKEDGESGVPTQRLEVKYLGDNLIDLIFRSADLSSLNFPDTKEHIKAVAKVEAFVLTVKDMKKVRAKFEGRLYKSQMKDWNEFILGNTVIQRRQKKMKEKLALDAQANV